MTIGLEFKNKFGTVHVGTEHPTYLYAYTISNPITAGLLSTYYNHHCSRYVDISFPKTLKHPPMLGYLHRNLGALGDTPACGIAHFYGSTGAITGCRLIRGGSYGGDWSGTAKIAVFYHSEDYTPPPNSYGMALFDESAKRTYTQTGAVLKLAARSLLPCPPCADYGYQMMFINLAKHTTELMLIMNATSFYSDITDPLYGGVAFYTSYNSETMAAVFGIETTSIDLEGATHNPMWRRYTPLLLATVSNGVIM